jgi:hypothetical protein
MDKNKSKLSPNTQKWLKALHIYLGCIWGGGAASLFAIHCLFNPASSAELYARNMALIYVDSYIIIPAAAGCFLTGILYSQLTRWGYVKYYWIIAKWFFTILFIVIGFFWLIPWLDKMMEFSMAMRDSNLIDSLNDLPMRLHLAMTVVQSILIFFVVVISVFKPWGRTGINW